jgi:hypothetical protein
MTRDLAGLVAVAVAVAVAAGSVAAAALPAQRLASGADPGKAAVAHADYRSFRQRYYDRFAPPYFYAPPAYRYARPPPPEPPGPPFAYGWQYGWEPRRPLSCGKYRYWDGEACVDARYWPPYVGPRY